MNNPVEITQDQKDRFKAIANTLGLLSMDPSMSKRDVIVATHLALTKLLREIGMTHVKTEVLEGVMHEWPKSTADTWDAIK